MRSYSGGVRRTAGRRFRGSLNWALVLGTLLALATGCGVRDPRLGWQSESGGKFRWVAGDTSRLLRNAHYFKLMGQPALAIKQLEEAHRLYPDNLKVTDALARSYDESGLHQEAQQIYRAALTLDPDNPVLLNNLGFSYYLAGKGDQAETCFRKSLARYPNNSALRNNLGLLLCRQGRREEARRLWQEAAGEAEAAQKLAQALAALGMTAAPRYGQPTRPGPHEPAPRRWAPPAWRLAAQPRAATANRRHASAPSAPVNQQPEPKARPAVPSPEVAAVNLAATFPPKQKASDASSREVPAPQPPQGQVTGRPTFSQRSAIAPQAGHRPSRLLPPGREPTAEPPPASLVRQTVTPARPEKAAPQAVRASQPDPKGMAGQTSPDKPRATPPTYLTARELMETGIAIHNGNGIPHLAHDTRSVLSLEGFNVVAIANYRDFGVDRTIIYYRPQSEHVATFLNNKFFPRAAVEPAPQLADRVDVKVILGHDLFSQQCAEVSQPPRNKSL
jgi:Tfp pilus assembly protein PilF